MNGDYNMFLRRNTSLFDVFTEEYASLVSLSTALLTEQIGMCRICLEETDIRRLLRPCKCKGTQAHVHEKCLEMWLKQKHNRICETCRSEYETEYRGLKPFREWTFPSPASDSWEDETDFFCSFIWAAIASRVFYAWASGGVAGFHSSLYAVFGSRRLVIFWWFSFFVNSVYYKYVLIDVLRRWWNENSLYTWRDCALPAAVSTKSERSPAETPNEAAE